MVNNWTLYRDFRFDNDQAKLEGNEAKKVTEIVQYLKMNPSLSIAIDGSSDPRGTNPRNQELGDQRVSAIRNALIKAGVPTAKIQTGAFGDATLARDRRVAVLVRTEN